MASSIFLDINCSPTSYFLTKSSNLHPSTGSTTNDQSITHPSSPAPPGEILTVETQDLNPILQSTISQVKLWFVQSMATSFSFDQLTEASVLVVLLPSEGREKPAQYRIQPGSPLAPWMPQQVERLGNHLCRLKKSWKRGHIWFGFAFCSVVETLASHLGCECFCSIRERERKRDFCLLDLLSYTFIGQ